MKTKIVCVVGPNGAGKEWVCKNVIPITGVPHRVIGISSLLGNTKLPQEEKKRIAAGKLVSDEFVLDLLDRAVFDHSKNYPEEVLIIDGFPRNLGQASFIKSNFTYQNTAILHVDADKETCYKQMQIRIESGKGRPDDNDKVFYDRWTVYEKEVLPAVRILNEDYFTFTVYGGIGIPEEMKLAPILRMFRKLGITLICNEEISLDEVCKNVKSISKTTLQRFSVKHPKIVQECPPVSLRA